MDIIFWITIVGGLVGIPLAIFQLVEYLKRQRSAKRVFRVVPEVYYDYDKIVYQYDKEAPRDVNLRTENTASASVHIQLDIVGLVDEEEVRLAPFLLIQQLSANQLNANAAGFELLGKGDGGTIRWFLAALGPDRPAIFRAPAFSFYCGEIRFGDTLDFFRLRKGEREVFELYILQVPGYRYQFKVGVPYAYKGQSDVHWLPQDFQVAMIDGPTSVFEWGGDKDDPIEEVRREMTEYRPRDFVMDALTRGEEALASVRGFEECWANKSMESDK